jgi:hypothetical protein
VTAWVVLYVGKTHHHHHHYHRCCSVHTPESESCCIHVLGGGDVYKQLIAGAVKPMPSNLDPWRESPASLLRWCIGMSRKQNKTKKKEENDETCKYHHLLLLLLFSLLYDQRWTGHKRPQKEQPVHFCLPRLFTRTGRRRRSERWRTHTYTH